MDVHLVGRRNAKGKSFYYYFLGFPASSPHPIEISKQNRFEEGKKIKVVRFIFRVVWVYGVPRNLPVAWCLSLEVMLWETWLAVRRCEKQIHGDVGTLWYKNWLLLILLGSFPCFHLQHGSTCLIVFSWLLAFICSNFDQSNIRVTIWIHFVRCMGIGDGGQSIETCWSYMSNPVQLCFHNSIPDKHLRSQYQCHKKGEHSKESAQWTAHFSDLCSILHVPRRATVLVTLKTKEKPKLFQENQPRPRKTKQKKTTAPFRVSSGVLLRTFRPCSPGFTRPVGQSLHGSAAWRRKLPPRRRPAVC